MRKVTFPLCFVLTILAANGVYAQSSMPQNTTSGTQTSAPAQPYPYVKGYLSFIIPWVTIQDKTVTPEFKAATTIGFPFGVNVYYSDKFGFSFEMTPSIMWEHQTGKSPAS